MHAKEMLKLKNARPYGITVSKEENDMFLLPVKSVMEKCGHSKLNCVFII
jgi:hypothetical protein